MAPLNCVDEEMTPGRRRISIEHCGSRIRSFTSMVCHSTIFADYSAMIDPESIVNFISPRLKELRMVGAKLTTQQQEILFGAVRQMCVDLRILDLFNLPVWIVPREITDLLAVCTRLHTLDISTQLIELVRGGMVIASPSLTELHISRY
jgi:hypothetical protein